MKVRIIQVRLSLKEPHANIIQQLQNRNPPGLIDQYSTSTTDPIIMDLYFADNKESMTAAAEIGQSFLEKQRISEFNIRFAAMEYHIS